MPRSSLATFSIAALAGAGIGGAGLAFLPRGGPSAKDEERAQTSMRTAAARGLTDGTWRIVDHEKGTRERQFARDPVHRDVVQIRFAEHPNAKAVPAPGDELTRFLLGDVEQFLLGYSVRSGPVEDGCATGRCVSFEWKKDGVVESPTRRVRFDAATGDLVSLVERDARGMLLRSLELTCRGLGDWRPTPARIEEVARRKPRPEFPEFVAFVRKMVPVYEPRELPPRFRRSDFGYSVSPPRGDVSRDPMPLVWVAYTDGVVRMNLLLAKPDQMRRLDEAARQQQTPAGPSACPTSPADTPDEILDGQMLVHRRDDGCRVVLRRDDLPGVAVALVGYRGLASNDYVRTIRSLVLVAPKPAEIPMHEAPVVPGAGMVNAK